MFRKSIVAAKDLLKLNAVDLLKKELNDIQGQVDDQKILSGKILSQLNRDRTDEILKNIQASEFKIFSQWGDDGIIQFLTDYLDIDNKLFVEFGVENYREANTRFLLIHANWKGLVMDGSAANILALRDEPIYWKHDISSQAVFITKENINSILAEHRIPADPGLLHIDLDGNDYWIWKEIKNIKPVIVIIEYNSVFGCKEPWSIPYDMNFNRTRAHHSNLYWGSSIVSCCDLAEEKGYYFIGSNSHGNNAYFIRKDKIKGLKPLKAEEGYVLSKFRESRGEKGNLTYLSGADRLNAIRGMKIFNTRTGEVEEI